MRRLVGNAGVTLLGAYALLCVYAAASAFWQPWGTLGLSADYGGYVRGVSPGGPAARAGIVAGDRIELAATPFGERRYVAGTGAALPLGTAVRTTIMHGRSTRRLELRAVPYRMTAPVRSALVFAICAALLFIGVGTTVIVRRPSYATWGFGLYCLTVLPTEPYAVLLPAGNPGLVILAVYDIAQNLGVVGLLLFALEFPRPLNSAWRDAVRRSLPAVFVVLAAMTLYPDAANLLLGSGARFENHLLQITLGALFSLAMFVLWDTYRHVALDERERMRWVIAGFSIGLLANYVGNTITFSSLIPIEPPAWLLNALVSLNVLLPLSVAHAIVRHRVLDINLVVSRALTYGLLTAALAGLFGLLDWLFGYLLEDFHLSSLVDALVTISIGLAFSALQKRTERVVESIFFRRRQTAELRLEHLASSVLQARSVEIVETALIAETVDALDLTSAAFFRHVDGSFTRTAAYGWHGAECASLDDTDLLVLAMRGDERCISLAELPWRRANVPAGVRAPLIAIRVSARLALAGIALYGGHPRGGDIDPGELAHLEQLAHACGVALDELEAERLFRENAVAAETIRELTTRLDELRRLTTAPDKALPFEIGATVPLPP